jgi:hypothetical protein
MAAPKRYLRKAGVALLRGDDAYAKRIRDMYGSEDPNTPLAQGMAGLLLGGAPARTAFAPSQADSQIGQLKDRAATIGFTASGLGARYGAPAAGISLAGKGLIDIANALSNPVEQTEQAVMPQ